jgi:RNA polymerase sigma factor (sigma-70 family)
MGAQPALADDIAQDAFITAWRELRNLRDANAFEPWVKRIAARLYVKRWRDALRTVCVAEPIESDTVVPDPGMRLDLDAALSRLSAPEQLCVSLCVGAGYTHEELAMSLRLPLGTVKSHVSRGLAKLRLILDGDRPRSGL